MRSMIVTITFLLGVAGVACGKSESSASEGGHGEGGHGEPAAGEPDKPAVAPNKVAKVVLAYDLVREGLAVDDLATTQATAQQLVEVAGTNQPQVGEAAKKVAGAHTLDQARKAFGATSKALLEAMQADSKLKLDGLVVYRCPMAEGYQKWLQLGPPMRNPYMGQKMLECGSKADFTP